MKLPSQKKYPKIVYIYGEPYRVIFTSKIKHYGDCDSDKRRIRIKKGLSKRETFATFVHEVLHGFSFERGFKLKHKTVYALERAIVDFIVSNFL